MGKVVDLSTFRQNANNHSVCADFAARWDACKTKKDLIDLAVQLEPALFLCKAISEGWGISPREIFDRFAPYINGKYESQGEYTGSLYCRQDGTIRANSTINVLIDCRAEVVIPPRTIVRIITDSASELKIICATTSKVLIQHFEGAKIEILSGSAGVKQIKI